MKTLFLSIFLGCFCLSVLAQTPNFSDTQIINGFAKKISGEDFSYHSSVPPAKECLLVRATDGN